MPVSRATQVRSGWAVVGYFDVGLSCYWLMRFRSGNLECPHHLLLHQAVNTRRNGGWGPSGLLYCSRNHLNLTNPIFSHTVPWISSSPRIWYRPDGSHRCRLYFPRIRSRERRDSRGSRRKRSPGIGLIHYWQRACYAARVPPVALCNIRGLLRWAWEFRDFNDNVYLCHLYQMFL